MINPKKFTSLRGRSSGMGRRHWLLISFPSAPPCSLPPMSASHFHKSRTTQIIPQLCAHFPLPSDCTPKLYLIDKTISLFPLSASTKVVEEVSQFFICLALPHQTGMLFLISIKKKKTKKNLWLIQRMESNGSSLVALFHKVVSVEGLNTKCMSILSSSGSNSRKKKIIVWKSCIVCNLFWRKLFFHVPTCKHQH